MIIRVFDIETVPDLTVWTPPKDKPDAFPPPHAHQVVALRWVDLDGAPKEDGESRFQVVSVSAGFDCGLSFEVREASILKHFRACCAREPSLMLVSWNGRRFDGPVLAARAMKHAIPWGWWWKHDPSFRHRYSEAQGHVDLMDVLADFGSAMPMKMGDAARLCGMPGKTDMDGSSVAAEIAAGNIEKVSRYCLFDVVQTAGIYIRHQYQKEIITRENVNLVFEQLEKVANHGRTNTEIVDLGRI